MHVKDSRLISLLDCHLKFLVSIDIEVYFFRLCFHDLKAFVCCIVKHLGACVH